MANYPVVPGPRMPYSIDGSVVFSTNGLTITEYNLATREAANDERGDLEYAFRFLGTNSNGKFGVIFPQLRDLTGFFLSCSIACSPVEYSMDTTTGLDGTWSIVTNTVSAVSMFPLYRTSISVAPVTRVKAIRFTSTQSSEVTYTEVYSLHLYGSIRSGETPTSRLGFWHPTIDQALPGSWLDWGDAARSTVAVKTFRLRNLSATETANNVALSVVAPTDLSPGVAGAHDFSPDGFAYSSTLNITSIGPNSYSPVISLKRTLASNQRLSLFAFRVQASVGSWS